MWGGGGFSEDLTDGRGVAFKVVAAREVLVKEGCREGMQAACVSVALQRWIRALVREWRSRAGAWRALVSSRLGWDLSAGWTKARGQGKQER